MKNQRQTICSNLLYTCMMFFFMVIIFSCERYEKFVQIETLAASDQTTSSLNLSGKIIDIGNGISEHGHCWSKDNQNPTPDNCDNKTNLGAKSSAGNFNSVAQGLNPDTKYYFAAYAISEGNIYQGKILNANTMSLSVPSLTTLPITDATDNSAKSGGNITNDGGTDIISRGVCWSESTNPTIDLTTKTSDGAGPGQYISLISGLKPNTNYYIRAYATNSVGTAYGNEISFLTSTKVPTISTTELSSITSTSAISGGNITDNGGAPVTSRGVCYNTSPNPTILNKVTVKGTGDGEFIDTLTGLNPCTKYYIRAYAINSAGTGYGEERNFTTGPGTPSLTTTAISSVTQTSAISGGVISHDGCANITAKGVCWSTSPNPTIALPTKTSDGTGTAPFPSSLNQLTPGTTYYIRAYATNSAGTGYGNEISFITNPVIIPTLTIKPISNITQTSASSGGEIIIDGGGDITAKGVCWSTSPNPTIALPSKTSDGTGTAAFTSILTPLVAGTTYYVRAYLSNSAGTGYSNEIDFTTSPVLIPTLTTTPISNITQTSATSGGENINDGGGNITAKGVCWSTSPNPTIALSTKTSDGAGNASFPSSLTPLIAGTTYYVRAYATNSAGTGYGNEINFTTNAAANTVTDVDGNIYNIIQIGTQYWMKENLKTTKYNDNTSITYPGTNNTAWSTNTNGAYAYYNNDMATYNNTYGALYNWYAVNTGKLCPAGWHVPSDAEWTTLVDFMSTNGYNYDGTTSGNKIAKALAATNSWASSSVVGSPGNTDYSLFRNKSGFSSLSYEQRREDGLFDPMGDFASYWSSTQYDANQAWNRYIRNNAVDLRRAGLDSKHIGFAVRCLKD